MERKMRTKKWMILIGILLSFVLMGTACQNEVEEVASEPQTVNVATLGGPTGMGMAQMITDGVDLGEGVDAKFEVIASPDQVTASVINKEVQIAALPTNVAAVLYNKTDGQVVLGAVNTLGVLYIMADESEGISTMADLKGKTILTSGQGATPEYVLNYLLEENGMTPGTDVTIDYVAEHSEVVTQLASGGATIGLLPEPFVTTIQSKKPSIKVAVDINEAWSDANDGLELPMGCIVMDRKWAEANPKIVSDFMEAYKVSVDAINEDPVTGAENVVALGIMQDVALAEKAIPNSNIVLIPAEDAEKALNEYFTILSGFEPKSIGGAIPGEDFYRIAK